MGGVADDGVLGRFGAATRAWFEAAFAGPTAAQAGAWRAVSEGRHALVVAPTGSGKTLAAFLWSLDQLSRTPPAEPAQRCRVLYVSPLKALAVDVERNLRTPLTGIRQAAHRLGLPPPEITVGMRTGDTPADERRAFAKHPPDILITTPESLFLLLTSSAREALRGVTTVIVDEVHAVCATKRGAHLALSLERLDALLPRPAQRIGLSATVRPVEETARFLGGAAPVEVVQPPSAKTIEVSVRVPVADMTQLDTNVPDARRQGATLPDARRQGATLPDARRQGADERRVSIWPAVEEQVFDLIQRHRSTIVFVNGRRGAERLCARLNELAEERAGGLATGRAGGPQPGDSATQQARPSDSGTQQARPSGRALAPAGPPVPLAGPAPQASPAEVMAQSGAAGGAAPVIARAHHGSISKEERKHIEEALKAGTLPAVVATSSLELGIDMGAVDLVVQVEAPPSVAAGLQRIGRAGHHVGAVSRGVVFPKHRGDLVSSAVVAQRMVAGSIEELRYPRNPLDVLAQQIVAMVAMEPWHVADLAALCRRSAPFAELPASALDATLDMLAGRYPSTAFAELRPRLIWDRTTDLLTARPGAQRLAVTSGGTIPDRGLFGVFLAGSTGVGGVRAGTARTGGLRVGELDEEMVYESRVGDVFLLGSTSWRIEEITPDRVLVSPAPGQPARMPFWKGDAPGRPVELGRAIGARLRELGRAAPERARSELAHDGLDGWAVENLLTYLREQREATRVTPDDRTIVVERFRDELGDWRLAVHCVLGARLNGPWALAIGRRLAERYGVDAQVMSSDDGIVVRLPDTMEEWPGAVAGAGAGGAAGAPPGADLVAFDPEEIVPIVEESVGTSALFAARFRECASRALLLPRRDPRRRRPLWQQRQRSAQLLDVAREYADFPITLEAARECLRDVFDLPALAELMRDLAARRVRLVEVETRTPSPFARSLLFGYVGAFLYEGDAPLAERRAAALALDPTLLSELLGRADLRELLDPAVLAETGLRLQWLAGDRHPRDAEDAAELLRLLGDLSTTEAAERGIEQAWLRELEASRRAIRVRIAGQERFLGIEDAGRVRDALGVALPVGVPVAFLEPVPDPLGDLLARYARVHPPFTATACAARFGLGVSIVEHALRRLASTGRLASGEFTPDATGVQWCDAEVLRLLRRRSLAALRKQIEPVPTEVLARFLPAWQHVGASSRGVEAVAAAIEQLQGVAVPASALERLVLPARVADYSPAHLDELCASGEVLWAGVGSIAGGDGWVSLAFADTAPLLLPPPPESLVLTPAHEAVLAALQGGQALFYRSIVDQIDPALWQAGGAAPGTPGSPEAAGLPEVIWDLVWAGLLSNDTLAPLRIRLSGTGAHRARPAPAHARYRRPGRVSLASLRSGPPTLAGRWYLLPARETDPTRRVTALTDALLERHGVLTRGAVAAENVPGGFAAVYPVLAARGERGAARRGYFVEGLGAAQFAVPGAVDRLRGWESPANSVGAGSRSRADPVDGFERDGGSERPGERWDERRQRDPVVLAATDPANPYGAALPWPERVIDAGEGEPGGHRAGRKAGALVVLVDGELVLYVERGGRTLLSYIDGADALAAAAKALAGAVQTGALGALSVQRADGAPIRSSPLGDALSAAGFRATPRGLRLRG
jgi:ATP-dependent Lhr-like helicase